MVPLPADAVVAGDGLDAEVPDPAVDDVDALLEFGGVGGLVGVDRQRQAGVGDGEQVRQRQRWSWVPLVMTCTWLSGSRFRTLRKISGNWRCRSGSPPRIFTTRGLIRFDQAVRLSRSSSTVAVVFRL
jgi:hypothetical protein